MDPDTKPQCHIHNPPAQSPGAGGFLDSADLLSAEYVGKNPQNAAVRSSSYEG